MNTMKCDEVRPFLVRLADGELEGPLDSVIAAHVEGCEKCRALLEQLQADRTLLRADEAPKTPAWLAARVMARIAEPAKPALKPRPALSPIAVVLLVVVGVSLGVALGAGISAREPNLAQRLAAAGVLLPPEAGVAGGK